MRQEALFGKRFSSLPQRPTVNDQGAPMSGILDTVQQQLSPDAVNQIAQQLGVDPATSQQAISGALPVVLGGIAGHAQDPAGVAAIHAEADNHAGLLGGLGGLLGDAGSAVSPGAETGGLLGGLGGMMGGMLGGGALSGILGSVLGGNHAAVQDGVAQASGLDPDRAKKLLFILVPIVLAAIAHHRRTAAADPSQMGQVLQRDAQTAQAQAIQEAPHRGGLLGAIMNQVMQKPR
jgi:hypothetical protein